MRRRQVLKTLAASSVTTVGAGTAAATRVGGATDVERVDALHVVSGGETVGTLPDPTWEDVRRVEAELDDDQQLVTPDGNCTAFCESNCPCYPCAYGCSNCCDPSNNVCSGCDDDGGDDCNPTVEPCPEP